MKKSHLFYAVSAALLATTAHAAPEVSGRLYLSGLYEDTDVKSTNVATGADVTDASDSTSRTTLNSAGSRLRVKGSETLTPNTDLEYWLEYAIKVDDDNRTSSGISQNFVSRNTYVGLKHKEYGTVRVGRIYTPDDDIDYVGAGYLYAAGADLPFTYYGQRSNNTIQYISPKIADAVQVKLHYAMDEENNTQPADPATAVPGVTPPNVNGGGFKTFKDGVPSTVNRDFIAGHVLYSKDKLNTGVAYTHAGDEFNALRAMVSYDVTDKLNLGVMAQRVDYNSGNPELGVVASGYYKLDPKHDVYAQVGFADNYGGYKDGETTRVSVGGIKWLKKDGGTRVRVFGSLNHADTTSFSGSGATLVKKETSAFGIETGLRYDF